MACIPVRPVLTQRGEGLASLGLLEPCGRLRGPTASSNENLSDRGGGCVPGSRCKVRDSRSRLPCRSHAGVSAASWRRDRPKGSMYSGYSKRAQTRGYPVFPAAHSRQRIDVCPTSTPSSGPVVRGTGGPAMAISDGRWRAKPTVQGLARLHKTRMLSVLQLQAGNDDISRPPSSVAVSGSRLVRFLPMKAICPVPQSCWLQNQRICSHIMDAENIRRAFDEARDGFVEI